MIAAQPVRARSHPNFDADLEGYTRQQAPKQKWQEFCGLGPKVTEKKSARLCKVLADFYRAAKTVNINREIGSII
ncbi:hypothetical protein [Sphingorhabdus sp. M41]|uniref:hypothetical protein n=1 Tax=Sphingorhabdus sp. M41 TaxID=1806885 RepID=UPI00078CBE9F|nr:hypothetical protein [Sphingorhabdus sp. M41]AMO71737.1 hypothetical protein AZE99_07635 [Sphingorhabdus sp. M41]